MDPQKSADTVRETQAELDGEQDKPVSQFDGYDLTAPSELDLGQPDSDQQNPIHPAKSHGRLQNTYITKRIWGGF